MNCQGFDIDSRGHGKHAVFVETPIGNQDMQVGMKPKKIAERLYGDNSFRYCLWVPQTGCVETQCSPRTLYT